MFNLYKKKPKPKISSIEKRVCDLEKPYKYEIGDIVTIPSGRMFVKNDTGVIVKRDYRYNDITIELRVMFGNNRNYEPEYERINSYDVYINNFKKTETLEERYLS